jgi:hypothetical protein
MSTLALRPQTRRERLSALPEVSLSVPRSYSPLATQQAETRIDATARQD